jgi:outer membrane protein assembly factor BamB
MNNQPTPRKPFRLWPGVVIAALMIAIGYVSPFVLPDQMILFFFAPVAGAVLILLWWLLFSRARWYERIGAIVVITAAIFAQQFVVHPSISGGAMGMLSYFLSGPTLCIALVGWAWTSRSVALASRAAAAVVAVLLGILPWSLVRTGGISGGGKSDFHWRWTPTPEERMLAKADDAPVTRAPVAAPASPAPAATPAPGELAPVEAAPTPAPIKHKPAEWPGFRGPNRDSVVRAIAIATDWAASPPAEMWHRDVGPGWSSFAVNGDLLYTQEQRGNDEVVSSYRVSTGQTVWRHRDATRFWESNGGAGPRATPTVADGRVYTFGATGILNSLDAISGAVIWSRNAATDTKVAVPMWGFSSSPLIIDDIVIVATSGRVAAYDAATGDPRWMGPAGRGGSYSSPQRMTVGGETQIVMVTGKGATGIAPKDGSALWKYDYPAGAPIVQPAILSDGDLLLALDDSMGGVGIQRVGLTHQRSQWTVGQKWESKGLKPYFNDFVVHKGYAFGFDGSILSCIDLSDGSRKWKGGRYGNGQLVLLPDQDLLLVTTEEGDLALVKAAPDQFAEVARVPALEGKTWNHPVIVRDVLLVRNDHEMAAFKLAPAARDKAEAPSTIARVSSAPKRRNSPSSDPRLER